LSRAITLAVNGAEKSGALAADDTVGFANRRAEMWWRMREALDPLNSDPIALPPDAALKADLAAPRWKLGVSGVLVESKDEMRKRLGRSPDRGDAVCMALLATAKAGGHPARNRTRTAAYVAWARTGRTEVSKAWGRARTSPYPPSELPSKTYPMLE
jgi:hypothetical protein